MSLVGTISWNPRLASTLATPTSHDRGKGPLYSLCSELGIAPWPFTIGLLGRLVDKKRPLLAIEALLPELPDARLQQGIERARRGIFRRRSGPASG